MAIRIDETFTLQAPIDRVFEFVTDPHRVVHCLPGAELTGETGERTYTGRVKIKVGPVVAGYSGQMRMTVVDAVTHQVRLVGEGRESGGAGSAKMTMTTAMRALETGATEVHVEAELDVAGKIVTFGRGMIENVNKQVFRQFVDCLRARLEAPVAAVTDAAPGGRADRVAASGPAAADGRPAPAGAASAAPGPAAGAAAPPLRIIPLVLHSLLESLARLLRRRRGAGRSGPDR